MGGGGGRELLAQSFGLDRRAQHSIFSSGKKELEASARIAARCASRMISALKFGYYLNSKLNYSKTYTDDDSRSEFKIVDMPGVIESISAVTGYLPS